jgi:hypothetical protein
VQPQEDEFDVTVEGTCQSAVTDAPRGDHISCPAGDAAKFSYTTTIKVPQVCVETITFAEEEFPATLQLYKSLGANPQAAGTYVPGSTLCGKLTITPSTASPLPDSILGDFVLDKVCMCV